MYILLLILISILSALVLTAVIFLTVNIFYVSKGYRGPLSDHFNGKRFFNIGWSPTESLRLEKSDNKKGGFFYWILHREKSKWRNRSIEQTQPKERNTKGIVITNIGHATLLIQVDGVNILTDPVWSKRASPFSWAGPRRFTAPGVKLEDMPPIDIILLSHNHYDHMDIASLRYFYKRDTPIIYTGLGNQAYLEKRDIKNVIDMDWWEEKIRTLPGKREKKGEITTDVKVIYLPAQHFSARGLTDRNKTLWGGFRVEIGGKSLYFAGDTGYGPFVEKIHEKYSEGFDIGLIPIGAYKPRWFMAPVHTDPFEGMLLQRELMVKKAIGIHYGTFDLADDNQDEPIEDLKKAKQDPRYRDQVFEIGPSGTTWNW